ncbi:hypothetical protein AMAG_19245 [Allomyces macrogynus ATCC 38327]|uniref:Uncharacterized protein n=1 Tax=Allomyces macrogynus (strain ATCC 38327) TaxID=578462 RepID=A0A0L0SQ91_ALLM3|nr:hypothetical protein AMAG_19245 [Allomyces macrogynus ATCC 38327]|eukprot:KNE64539.1 hypothetical protein AMAG_19245 [Allomyces macrogynus ATCC 38327]
MADAERKDRAQKDAETDEREWLEAQMERARVLTEEREAKARAAAAATATGNDCAGVASDEGVEKEEKDASEANVMLDPDSREQLVTPSDASAPAPPPPPSSSTSTGFVKSSQPIKLNPGLKKPVAPITTSSAPTAKKRGLAAMMSSMPSSAASSSSTTSTSAPPPPPRPTERSALERIMEEERERKRRREERTSKLREPGVDGFRRVH